MINVYNPAFQVNLSQKYYLHSADAAIITAEDRSWFKKQGTIRIGYLRHMAPFIEEGPDGKARGMFRDLIDHGFEAFDIHNKVEYVPYGDPNAMKRDLIQRGPARLRYAVGERAPAHPADPECPRHADVPHQPHG